MSSTLQAAPTSATIERRSRVLAKKVIGGERFSWICNSVLLRVNKKSLTETTSASSSSKPYLNPNNIGVAPRDDVIGGIISIPGINGV